MDKIAADVTANVSAPQHSFVSVLEDFNIAVKTHAKVNTGVDFETVPSVIIVLVNLTIDSAFNPIVGVQFYDWEVVGLPAVSKKYQIQVYTKVSMTELN